MFARNYYHRSFVIFQPLDSGFAVSSTREPGGYCKMEVKKNQGKIYLYAQDLRPAEDMDGIYDVVLASENQDINPLKIGSIQANERGRAEETFSFDASNIHESGTTMEEYHAILVVFRTLGKEKLSIQYPLAGYSNKRVQLDIKGKVTKALEKIYTTEQNISELNEENKMSEDENVKIKETDNIKAANEEKDYEDNTGELKTGEIEGKEEIEAIQTEVENQENEISYDDMDVERLINEALDISDVGNYYDMKAEEGEKTDDFPYEGFPGLDEKEVEKQSSAEDYWDNVKDYFNGLFSNHKKICPFDDNTGEVEWIRIQQSTWYPGSTYNDHYLVGLMREKGRVKYVIYGIPGPYGHTPPIAINGFSRWLPVKYGYGQGYWLLYIDAITGRIAYPF